MELALQRRLTGAVVLVLFAVLFVPAVLDGPDDSQGTTEVGLALPEPDAGDGDGLAQHRYQLDEDPEPEPGTELSGPGTQPVGRADPDPAPTSAPAQPAPAPADIEAWAVQVGSFSSRANAEGLVEQLGAAGFQAFIVRIEEGGRALYRVRVGPEQDRRRAEVLAERLAGEVEATPRVVQHP